jgi:hypothetical protein
MMRRADAVQGADGAAKIHAIARDQQSAAGAVELANSRAIRFGKGYFG